MATGNMVRPWTGCIAISCSRAISYSTSARTWAIALPPFGRLGARVVAVEPQPALLKTLRLLYGRDPKVTIEAAAVGRQPGVVELSVNVDNPTVSTVSTDFIAAAANAPGWEGQAWSKRIRVPLTTIDALIATARNARLHQDRR